MKDGSPPTQPLLQENSLTEGADHAFTRAAGAELIPGNQVGILRDADENYPAWLEAIRSATRSIYFETYIFADDETGREFVSALTERARSGVRVRVLHDWFGTPRGRGLLAPLVSAGATVRRYNPPRLDSPLGWLARDHRKMIAIDGRRGFVSGLCVSSKWRGDPSRGVDPWRDTGVDIVGPAVAELERAFADVWDATGRALPQRELTPRERIPAAGHVSLRVVAGVPNRAGLFRMATCACRPLVRKLNVIPSRRSAPRPGSGRLSPLAVGMRLGASVRGPFYFRVNLSANQNRDSSEIKP